MTTNQEDTIECCICGAKVHVIEKHLERDHKDVKLSEYQARYPDAPILSKVALEKIAEHAQKSAQSNRGKSEELTNFLMMNMHEVFGLNENLQGVKNDRGNFIKIPVIDGNKHEFTPDVDKDYVYDISTLRDINLAIVKNYPLYVWGHTGTGKTTICLQYLARTNRPVIRAQHTLGTEERDIVGQWTAKNGQTVFNLGPLAYAMRHGLVYLADEYDFALPAVLAVYQAVLEGEPLVIKDADMENRIIRPHPNFRFIATGNTNGTGDESLLYAGTTIQNAANYDRFGIVIEKKYMPEKLEVEMVIKQAKVNQVDAEKIIDFGRRIRGEYEAKKLNAPISPRTLVRIGEIYFAKGNFRAAIELTYSNKLSRQDKLVVDSLAQRIFG